MPSWAGPLAAAALGQRCAQQGSSQAAAAWILHHVTAAAGLLRAGQQQPPWQQHALVAALPARGGNSWLQLSSWHSPGRRSAFSSAASALAQQPVQQQQPQPHQRARVLDGRAVASAWLEQLQAEVPALTRALLGRAPVLVVVLVGARPDSVLYVTRKQEACARTGVECRVVSLPESVSQQQLTEAVAAAAADPGVDGLLVQLPLPRHLDEEGVMEAIEPVKDVDGFHPTNMGRMLMRGRAPRFVPATPLGVVQLLSRCGIGIAGRTAVMLGDSNIVGQPLAALLRDEGAALVTTCHRVSYAKVFEEQAGQLARARADVCLPRLPGPAPAQPSQQGSSSSSGSSGGGGGFETSQLPAICSTADILVVAVGSPELVRAHWVKPGACVIDVGINVVPCSPRNQQQQQQQQQQPDAAGATSSSLQLAQGSGGSEVGGGSGFCVVGDVAADEVARVASVLTPVPGGVGPMTVAALLHNTLQAARYRAGLLRW